MTNRYWPWKAQYYMCFYNVAAYCPNWVGFWTPDFFDVFTTFWPTKGYGRS